ncbi:hypothetical protein VTI28DRAFT_9585 [Corynascus sepedonium]
MHARCIVRTIARRHSVQNQSDQIFRTFSGVLDVGSADSASSCPIPHVLKHSFPSQPRHAPSVWTVCERCSPGSRGTFSWGASSFLAGTLPFSAAANRCSIPGYATAGPGLPISLRPPRMHALAVSQCAMSRSWGGPDGLAWLSDWLAATPVAKHPAKLPHVLHTYVKGGVACCRQRLKCNSEPTEKKNSLAVS